MDGKFIKSIEEIKRVTVKGIQGTFISVLKDIGELNGRKYADWSATSNIIKNKECDVILAKVDLEELTGDNTFAANVFGNSYVNPYGVKQLVKQRGDKCGYALYFLHKGLKIGEQENGDFLTPNYKQVIFALKDDLSELEKFMNGLETNNAFVIVEDILAKHEELVTSKQLEKIALVNGTPVPAIAFSEVYSDPSLYDITDGEVGINFATSTRAVNVFTNRNKIAMSTSLKVYFGADKIKVLNDLIPSVILGDFASNFELDKHIDDFNADKVLYSAKCTFENLIHKLKLPKFPEDVADYFTLNIRGDYTGPTRYENYNTFTQEQQTKFKLLSERYEKWDRAMTDYTNVKEAATAYLLALESRSFLPSKFGGRNAVYTTMFNRINHKVGYYIQETEPVQWEYLALDTTPAINKEYNKTIFMPDAKHDINKLKARLSDTYSCIWYGETDEGEEYMNLSVCRASDNVDMITDMFSGLDVSKVKELNPFMVELEKLLTEKLEKHVQPSINFGSCSVESVTKFANERAVRIEILKDVIYNIRLLILLNEKVFKDNAISMVDINYALKSSSLGMDMILKRALDVMPFVHILKQYPKEDVNPLINKVLKYMTSVKYLSPVRRDLNSYIDSPQLDKDGTIALGAGKHSSTYYGDSISRNLVNVIEFMHRMSKLGVNIK